MPQALIDIGCNLAHESFDKDRQEVISRASQAGISGLIITGTSVMASQLAQRLAAQYSGYCHSTAGVHPHDSSHWNDSSATEILKLSKNPEVVAIGETGLDYHRNFSSRKDQLRAFEAQLELGVITGLPLFLHQRDAHGDFLKLVRLYRNSLSAAVVHCFTGTHAELEDYLALDCHIGLTGWICDERRGLVQQTLIPHIPLDRLMLETDAPYLMPRNMIPKAKGRRNEPANLPWILKMVAQCREEDADMLAKACTENTLNFFKLSK
jgi:TatD DNase family protein